MKLPIRRAAIVLAALALPALAHAQARVETHYLSGYTDAYNGGAARADSLAGGNNTFTTRFVRCAGARYVQFDVQATAQNSVAPADSAVTIFVASLDTTVTIELTPGTSNSVQQMISVNGESGTNPLNRPRHFTVGPYGNSTIQNYQMALPIQYVAIKLRSKNGPAAGYIADQSLKNLKIVARVFYDQNWSNWSKGHGF